MNRDWIYIIFLIIDFLTLNVIISLFQFCIHIVYFNKKKDRVV